jgi:hypothetical protein
MYYETIMLPTKGHCSPWHKIQQPKLHNKDMKINHTTIVN